MSVYRYSNEAAELTDDGFGFKSLPTKEQTEPFEYVEFDYFEDNPATVNNIFIATVGVYYDPITGETT